MPAIGIVALIFVVVQALISAFVYSEANEFSSVSALVAGISVFVLGVTLAIILNGVLEIVAIELLLILVYLIGQRVAERRSLTA